MPSSITPYCISVYVIHLTSQGARYLLIRRCGAYLPGTWQMISGGIEPKEAAPTAALREIQEETGLIPTALYSADAVETFYMQRNDQITFAPVFVAFVEEIEVSLSPEEHDAYEWLSFEDAKHRLIWAEQKRVISQIHHAFVLNQPNPLLLIERTPSASIPPKSTISRTGVYGIVTQNEKFLLVKQRKGPHLGKWDLPGGGIEPGETIEEALRREFLEEVGMDFDTMTLFTNLTATSVGIDETGNDYDVHQVGLIYQIRGISQSNLHSAGMEYAWIDPEQLEPGNISPFLGAIL